MYNKPVSSTNISSIVARHTADVDNDTQNHESDTGDNLHQTEDVFDFSIASDTKELDDDKSDQEWNNESGGVDVLRSWPIMDDVDGGRDLVREDC